MPGSCSPNGPMTSPEVQWTDVVTVPHLRVQAWVAPAFVLNDPELMRRVTQDMLTRTATRLPERPEGLPWHLGPVSYAAGVVPHDPERVIFHPLSGQRADADTVVQLATRCVDAADEVDGSWALMAFADVVFDA